MILFTFMNVVELFILKILNMYVNRFERNNILFSLSFLISIQMNIMYYSVNKLHSINVKMHFIKVSLHGV